MNLCLINSCVCVCEWVGVYVLGLGFALKMPRGVESVFMRVSVGGFPEFSMKYVLVGYRC